MLKTKREIISDFRGVSGEVNERLLPSSYASVSYNFDCSDGTLKDGMGLKIMTFPQSQACRLPQGEAVKKLCYFKRFLQKENKYKDEILIFCRSGACYRFRLDDLEPQKTDFSFEETPKCIKYKYGDEDVLLLSVKGELYCYDGESLKKIEGAPEIKDMCIHNERLFVTTAGEGTTLYYSEDFNPFNFSHSLSGGGYVDFQDERGALQRVVSSTGYLYLFRSFGISRLTAFYDQSNFSVDHLFTSTGKIYPESITPCADGIVFLAKEGFYKLTQSGVSKILSRYDAFLRPCDNQEAKGVYHDGCLYVKCKMKFASREEKVTVVYDVAENKTYISKGLNVADLISVKGENFSSVVFAVENASYLFGASESCTVDNLSLVKLWKTPLTDFNLPSVDKCVTRIEAIVSGEVTVVAESGKERRKIKLKGKDTLAAANLKLRGKEFSFTFSSSSAGCKIYKPIITFSYYE